MKRINCLSFLVLIMVLTFSCGEACDTVNCQNGGICTEGVCGCPDGFLGEFCEIKDLCFEVTCEYGGDCINNQCACIELNKDYIVGKWLVNDAYFHTFNSDGSFLDAGGIANRYVVYTDTWTIDLIDENGTVFSAFYISKEGFECNKYFATSFQGEIPVPIARQ